MGDSGLGHIQTDLGHRLVELVTIFCLVDRLFVRTDHLDAVLLQYPLTRKVEGTVERGLTTHGGQKRIGPLLLDNAGDALPGDRLKVGGVGHLRIGHNRCRIGVDQNDPIALFTQCLTGLRTGIVKLTRLSDNDGTCADNKNRIYITTFWHGLGFVLFNKVDKVIKQWCHIVRPGARLGMALKTECGAVGAVNPL